ncbi:ankyrin [Rickenella mellea]|uniref:Ankyrin n=1 Tax=Rickenella mellea TaxID=50990 RepID=A0A4Y7QBX8_9AGAM|nr:ankyrin [Rickenella mellea]
MTNEETRRKEAGSWGLWFSPEMRRLVSEPGYLNGEKGRRLQSLFTSESLNLNPGYGSNFAKACFYGDADWVKRAIEAGIAPDVTGCESDLRIGYTSFVVLGAQRTEWDDGAAVNHGEVLKVLIGKGCPVDLPDLMGYTAFTHSATNRPRLDLAEILVRHGANVNHRNKFGAVALHGCLLQNHWKSIDFLLGHGADMNIRDADGTSPAESYTTAGPQIVAVVRKWERKANGEGEASLESKSCHVCGKTSKEAKPKLCSTCRLVSYCSAECQNEDWGAHKRKCKSADRDVSITLKPTYDTDPDQYASPAEMTRQRLAIPESVRTPDPRPQQQPARIENASHMTIKVQLSLGLEALGSGTILVYNRKRTFICHITREINGEAFDRLTEVIKEKGVPLKPGGAGMKAYLQADLEDRNRLVVRAGEVLAEQPF